MNGRHRRPPASTRHRSHRRAPRPLATAASLFAMVLLSACATGPKTFSPPLRMVAAVPVANVRAKPVPHPGTYEFDPLQETQIEEGEPVLVVGRDGDWFQVSCPEQLEFTHNDRWEGYPGWVRRSALTRDLSRVHALRRLDAPASEVRAAVLEQARRHLGHPYLWGGRSLHDPANEATPTGVDCSGLVNWSFRQVGWFVPRDAHEQFLRARPADADSLEPADLIFLAKREKPEKIVHVAFYAGDGRMLEAPSSGERVRLVAIEERLGRALADLTNGGEAGDFVVRFGSFFPRS